MKKVGISILGLGVVGTGTYEILLKNREFYQKTQHVDLVVESVLELNRDKALALEIPEEQIASNIAEVVLNPDVNIVVECIGGIEAAREYVLAALNAGKTVVTSNKELICKYSHELERAAQHQNAGLYYEASCVGGVPIIRTLLDGVQSNKVSSLFGIINGTTNYILTKMAADGVEYTEALNEAKRLGYAEADPTADVAGYDAAYKLSILASLAFHTKVPLSKVYREGIEAVSAEDIQDGNELGYALKLLAIGKRTGDNVEVRVHPTFIKKEHPLSGVSGCFNAVFLTGDSLGELMLYGQGAGAYPTGSAIVSDIIYAATHAENKYSPYVNGEDVEKNINFNSDFKSSYYLRFTVSDQTGVLSKLTAIFGKYGISIFEILQKKNESGKMSVIIVTHDTHELAVQNAVEKINSLEVAVTESVLRVVS